MRIFSLSLLVYSSLAFGWSVKKVETDIGPVGWAYVRHIKRLGVDRWYLLIPGMSGYQVHPVTVTRPGCQQHLHMNSTVYGVLVLPFIELSTADLNTELIFQEPDPFEVVGSLYVE